MERIPDDVFARVGLRTDSAQARAFAAALAQAAASVRAERGPGHLPASWPAAAVNRALAGLSRCQLGDLAAGLGLGEVAFGDEDRGDPADPVRAVLHHLLRDRLVDLLRLSAGQPAFWVWGARPAEER